MPCAGWLLAVAWRALARLRYKVQVQDDGPYYYPDLVVSCDERDGEAFQGNRTATQLIRYPMLIVEVLSASTESKDRGRKFRQLQRSETLQEYVLIDYASVQVECFRRSDGRFWIYEAFGEGETVQLKSIGFDCAIPLEGLAIATIYEDVNFGN